MRLWLRFRSWLRAAFRRSALESETDTELRFHMESFADDLVRKGVPRQEAMRLARIELAASSK